MMGPRWIATLCATMAFGVLALGQDAEESKIMKVTQNGRVHECKLLNMWMDGNGSLSYLVQDLRTGEQFTVIETAPASDRVEPEPARPAGYDTVPKMFMRAVGIKQKPSAPPAMAPQVITEPAVPVETVTKQPPPPMPAQPVVVQTPATPKPATQLMPPTAPIVREPITATPQKPTPAAPAVHAMTQPRATAPVAPVVRNTPSMRPMTEMTAPVKPAVRETGSMATTQRPQAVPAIKQSEVPATTATKPSHLPEADPKSSRSGLSKWLWTPFRNRQDRDVEVERQSASMPKATRPVLPEAKVVSHAVPAKSVAPGQQKEPVTSARSPSGVVQASSQTTPGEAKNTSIQQAGGDQSKSMLRRMVDVPEAEKVRQAEREKAAKEGKVEQQEESLWYGFSKMAGNVQKRFSKGMSKSLEAVEGSSDHPLYDRKKTTDMPPPIQLPGREVESDDPLMNPKAFSRDRLQEREEREKKERAKIEKSLQSKAPDANQTTNLPAPKVRGAKPYEYSEEVSVRPVTRKGKPRRLGIISIDAREPNAFSMPRQNKQSMIPPAGWSANAFAPPTPEPQPQQQPLPNMQSPGMPLPMPRQLPAPTDPNLQRASFQAQQSAAQKNKELVTALQYSMYPSAREQATESLSRLDWKSETWVIDVLIKSADRDPAATVRAASIRALVSMKANTPEVKRQLEGSLRDIDERVRREANAGLQSLMTR